MSWSQWRSSSLAKEVIVVSSVVRRATGHRTARIPMPKAPSAFNVVVRDIVIAIVRNSTGADPTSSTGMLSGKPGTTPLDFTPWR